MPLRNSTNIVVLSDAKLLEIHVDYLSARLKPYLDSPKFAMSAYEQYSKGRKLVVDYKPIILNTHGGY